MKTFQHISKLVLTALALGTAAGCSDDFLTPDPLSLYEPTATFSTESGLQSALASADKHLKSYWTGTTAIDLMLPIMSDYLFSDVAVASKTDDANIFCDIKERFTPNSGWYNFDQNRLVMFWGETYNGIKYANTIVSYIDQVKGMSQETKDIYLGRAYFHRSLRYLNLCFEFGDVPFVTKIVDSPKQNYRSTKRAAIIRKLTQDMEFAVQHVPEQSTMDYLGMVNKGACRQLLVKCYLANGEFRKAKLQADTLIEHSGYHLMEHNFGTFVNPFPKTWAITENVIWDLHRPENKAVAENREAILIMPNRYGSSSGINICIMRNLGPQWNASGNRTPDDKLALDRFALVNASYADSLDWNRAVGRGQGIIRPTWFAEHGLWRLNGHDDQGDLRHSSKVGNWVNMEDLKYNRPDSKFFGQPVRKTFTDADGTVKALCADTIRAWFGWPHYKIWYESPQDETPTANNYRGGYGDMYFYRLAETYLLRAEAEYYLGDIAAATRDVNVLRRRAHCDQLYSSVTIDDIADERARELYMEEWRFTELSRMSYCLALSGKPDNEGTIYNVGLLHENSFWWHRICRYNNYYNKPDAPVVKGRHYTMGAHNINWPIPQSAINANLQGTLRQNPGYDGYDPAVKVWETWEEAVADEQ